jgi:8-oxo-dGTP pyrophosphatase MutT (NUDIX family)
MIAFAMSTAAAKIPSKVLGTKSDITYTERLAVRIVTKNDKDEIIILHVKKGNYYKLPGGGIEADEDHRIAAQREAMEETGCKVSLEGECMAKVEEWRNDLHQLSYCYRAHLVEDTGAPDLTEEEVVDGLQHEWVSIKIALDKMKAIEPTSELGRYIKERDIFFVETFIESTVQG